MSQYWPSPYSGVRSTIAPHRSTCTATHQTRASRRSRVAVLDRPPAPVATQASVRRRRTSDNASAWQKEYVVWMRASPTSDARSRVMNGTID